MPKKYVIVDGFIVADKAGGEIITDADVPRVDILLESGRIIPAASASSAKIKDAKTDVPKEDD